MTRPTTAWCSVVLAIAPVLTSCASRTPVSCTEIGNAEGVSVDLRDVLDPQGGFSSVEVHVDAVDVAQTTEFAGNDAFSGFAHVEADLGPEPTRVDVVVSSTRGPDRDPATAVEVFTASGDVRARPFQPNGAACDGENYAMWVRATDEGGLVEVFPASSAPTDATSTGAGS